MEGKKRGKRREHRNKEKKEVKEYKRGLLDILDSHACAGSEIGGRERDLSPEVKDKLPYAPSQKSMPSSTFSEDNNIPEKCEPSGKRKKSSAHKKKAKEVSLGDLPSVESKIKVFDGSTMSNEQAVNQLSIQTGCDTVPTKQTQTKEVIADIMLATSNDSLLDENIHGNGTDTLAENAYKTIAYSADVVKKNEKIPSTKNCSKENSAIFPRKEKKLKNAKKDSFRKDENNILPDNNLVRKKKELEINSVVNQLPEVHKSKKTAQKSVVSEKLVLQLFDCNGYPLTDYDGNILKSADGQNLVTLKNGLPFTDCFNRFLYDKQGISSDNPKFNAYSNKKLHEEAFFKIPLYDFRGYPLTDAKGAFLRNSKGEKLVLVDIKGKLLNDINGNPIFDVAGIPLTKKGNCWLNPRGTPYRVFNCLKYPLTDKRGRSIMKRNSQDLLKCDKFGRPVLDINKDFVYDENGFIYTDPKFNPTTPLEKDSENFVILIKDTPEQVYNRDDLPLTDSDGMVLKDSYGKYLINLSFLINSHMTVTQEKSTAVNCIVKDVLEEEISPLESGDLPLTDAKGEFVYNSKGEQVLIDAKACHKIQSQSKITDKVSCVLSLTSDSLYNFDSDTTGERDSVKCEEEICVDFDTETDMFGRPLFDEDGSALFDKYGRPVRDLFLRPLYDPQGCPISTADGKLLKDGSAELPGVHPGFDVKYLSLHDPEGTLQLSDRQGGPIHDDMGQPLYNAHGKPLKDAFGRPLYDDSGYPLCDHKGLPASAIIKNKGLEIAEVNDKFQRLTVSSQGQQNLGILDECIIDEDGSYSNGTYNARLRLTSFVNGETVVELLEVSPLSENT